MPFLPVNNRIRHHLMVGLNRGRLEEGTRAFCRPRGGADGIAVRPRGASPRVSETQPMPWNGGGSTRSGSDHPIMCHVLSLPQPERSCDREDQGRSGLLKAVASPQVADEPQAKTAQKNRTGSRNRGHETTQCRVHKDRTAGQIHRNHVSVSRATRRTCPSGGPLHCATSRVREPYNVPKPMP